MKIYGVSQSSGVERLLTIERGIEGVVLTLNDHVGGKEQGRIFVPGDALVAAIMQPTPGGLTIEGIPQPQHAKTQLNVEVRGNDVLMTMRPGSDVAVGLDDIQDALEGVIGGSAPTAAH
jgi:hypothetical protein